MVARRRQTGLNKIRYEVFSRLGCRYVLLVDSQGADVGPSKASTTFTAKLTVRTHGAALPP